MVHDMEKGQVRWGAAREHALTAEACISLYRKTKDEAHRTRALEMMRSSVPVEEMCPAWANMLFFAYEETGDDGWRGMIEQVAARILPEPARLDEAYDVLPFRMAYEMKMNRMAWVNRVADSFKALHARLFDVDTGLHQAAEGEAFSPEATAWFMLALVDAIEICDQQLYEHWRAMVDIFRVTLRGLVRNGRMEGAEKKIACSIFKAIQLGIIDPERYLPVVDQPDEQRLFTELTLKGGNCDEN